MTCIGVAVAIIRFLNSSVALAIGTAMSPPDSSASATDTSSAGSRMSRKKGDR